MNLLLLHNPADLVWQTNLFDATMVVMFCLAVAYAIVQWHRGIRIYGTLLLAAFLYGLVLELGGMAALNMYTQGDFIVMLNFPALRPFQNTTAMPSYVLIFYPVFLFTGFKVVEALGITKRWQSAIAGGLFMIALDAPYIIEGGLRHIVWWTWHTDFSMFQYWLGWPLIDLCWQATWDAMFFYLMLRAVPHVDGAAESRWSNARCLGAFAPLSALGVIASGCFLLTPLTAVTFLGGRQWPVVVALVLAYVKVTATALRSAQTPRRQVEFITAWSVGVYAAAFAAMVVANFLREGGLVLYVLVQAAGLLVICVLTLFPLLRRQQRMPIRTSASVGEHHSPRHPERQSAQ